MSKKPTHEEKTLLTFLALGAVRCETFAPHFQTHFIDKNDELNEHRPDYIYTFPDGKVLFIESKQGGSKALNSKQSKKSCHNKLRYQYKYRFRREPGNMTHSALSAALWKAGHVSDCLDHAWNHSLVKVLITQKALGREHFIVVFTEPPMPKHAENYNKKGLSFITLADLPKFLGQPNSFN